ncbi:hypothetical protein A2U01_0069239, partial [Trifolium medium]|nr:hypothetical protein [Trifolium medium]
ACQAECDELVFACAPVMAARVEIAVMNSGILTIKTLLGLTNSIL